MRALHLLATTILAGGSALLAPDAAHAQETPSPGPSSANECSGCHALPDIVVADDGRYRADLLVHPEDVQTTLVFATHRLAAAELCDRVVVLDGGRVVEAGSPVELAARGGRYARLLALQRLGDPEALPAAVRA